MNEIPLTNGSENAHQTFSILLGDNYLEFDINYLTRFGHWVADVKREGVYLARGVMLVPEQTLLDAYQLDIGGNLAFIGDEPTLDNLGSENTLVWLPNE